MQSFDKYYSKMLMINIFRVYFRQIYASLYCAVKVLFY